jgi:hypothetical protein
MEKKQWGEPPENWGEPPQNWVTHPIVLPLDKALVVEGFCFLIGRIVPGNPVLVCPTMVSDNLH